MCVAAGDGSLARDVLRWMKIEGFKASEDAYMLAIKACCVVGFGPESSPASGLPAALPDADVGAAGVGGGVIGDGEGGGGAEGGSGGEGAVATEASRVSAVPTEARSGYRGDRDDVSLSSPASSPTVSSSVAAVASTSPSYSAAATATAAIGSPTAAATTGSAAATLDDGVDEQPEKDDEGAEPRHGEEGEKEEGKQEEQEFQWFVVPGGREHPPSFDEDGNEEGWTGGVGAGGGGGSGGWVAETSAARLGDVTNAGVSRAPPAETASVSRRRGVDVDVDVTVDVGEGGLVSGGEGASGGVGRGEERKVEAEARYGIAIEEREEKDSVVGSGNDSGGVNDSGSVSGGDSGSVGIGDSGSDRINPGDSASAVGGGTARKRVWPATGSVNGSANYSFNGSAVESAASGRGNTPDRSRGEANGPADGDLGGGEGEGVDLGQGGVDWRRARILLDDMETAEDLPTPPPAGAYEAVLDACVAAGRVGDALEVAQAMAMAGHRPNPGLVSRLTSSHADVLSKEMREMEEAAAAPMDEWSRD